MYRVWCLAVFRRFLTLSTRNPEAAIRTPREKKSVKRSHRLTDAGRKRLSDIMKARWASGHPPIKFKKKKAA
jgi:hypothetical protein